MPKILSTSCDQSIFVVQATDASVSSDAIQVEVGRFGQWFQRRGAVQAAVRPVLIVVGLILVQDPPQMGLVPDESWYPCGGRRAGVKIGVGCPPTPAALWYLSP